MYDFSILILEGAFSSSVAVTQDILSSAQKLALRAGVAPPRWRLCSTDGGIVNLQGGMTIKTTKLSMRAKPDTSLWLVPGIGLSTPDAITERFKSGDAVKIIAALKRHIKEGGQIAASCSSVFLLQAAGLLEGRRVTTTWWLAPYLQHIAPDCRVNADRMICEDGPVITAGAAFAQTDLMLYLLRERFGSKLTDTVSRMMLIDGRHAQAPFIIPEALASGNNLVSKFAEMVNAALPIPPSIAELARNFCMSERTLSRHIHKVTGKTPLALVQSVRLRRARMLLEESRMNVDQVAEAVGYRDATALRRLMKKISGVNPSSYRR